LIGLRWAALALILGCVLLLGGCGTNTPPYNNTPVIGNLFPSSTPAGGASFTLSITGTGFISTSTAYWNNTKLTTTFNASTLDLSAMVPASDIASSGVAQIVVVTPSPGGGMSNAVTFTITAPQNPLPAIGSLSPAATAVGVLPPGNVLVVNGTNFVPASSSAFNGVSRATTFVSATQLNVAMAASDVAVDTTISVTVSNPTPGGGVSNAVSFPVGTGGSLRRKPGAIASGASFPQLVSVGAAGEASNGQSAQPVISADGRFTAFRSQATNLVAQGASGNVFWRDTCLGAANCSPQTVAVDLAPDGSAPNAQAGTQIAVSGDGRFVAFASSATNLVPAPAALTGSQANVYVRDLCLGADPPAGCIPHTALVSVGSDGNAAAGSSDSPSISDDGRFIAFVSSAAERNGASAGSGVFVRDTCWGSSATNACVAKTYLAQQGFLRGERFANPVISSDGRFVAFVASLGVERDSSQVLIADMCLGTDAPASCLPSISLVSSAADGSAMAGANRSPAISADGRFVVFESQTSGEPPRVFIRDTCLGAPASANCVRATTLLLEEAAAASISATGRYISYLATAANSAADASAGGSLYGYDTCFGATVACTPQSYPVSATTTLANASPVAVAAAGSAPLSSDGSFIVFSTSEAIAGLPLSGPGEVLLSVTPF
jgi:hypothetical protein